MNRASEVSRPRRRPPESPPPRRGARARVAGAIRTYGWRIGVIPVLIVLMMLVLVQSWHGSGGQRDAAGSAGRPAVPAPRLMERPATPVNLASGTAALPAGGDYTHRGAGTWHLVRGGGGKVGTGGPLLRYTVTVEDGIDPAAYGGDRAFARMVEATLSDPRSWIGSHHVSLQRVGDPAVADFEIALTTPATDHRICGDQIPYEASCYNSTRGTVVINLARWVRGARAFNGDIGTYRQYTINHEVGHALGEYHVGCRSDGALAPVMMQQTFGVSDDYLYRLNQADGSNATAVRADGRVCKPNAWPVPQPGGATG